MDKELFSYFINAAFQVLYDIIEEKPKPGQVKIINKISSTQGMVILVGIVGDLEGRIILDILPESGHKLSEIIMQEKINKDDYELIESAISELANMIVGRAISDLNEKNYKLKISPPTILKGNDLVIINQENNMLIVPITTSHGDIILNFSIRKKT